MLRIGIFILTTIAHTCFGSLHIHRVANEQETSEEVMSINRWAGGEKVSIVTKPFISSEDVIRVVIKKRVIPEVTQEQIDEVLGKLSEEQRDNVAEALKPSPEKTEVYLSFILTNEATKSFRKITKESVGHTMALVVDGKALITPKVLAPILDGIVQINVDSENAEELLEAFPPSNPKVFIDNSMVPK